MSPSNCVSLGANGVLVQTMCSGPSPKEYVYLTTSAAPTPSHTVWTFATDHPLVFACLFFLVVWEFESTMHNLYRLAVRAWNDVRTDRMIKQDTAPVEADKL